MDSSEDNTYNIKIVTNNNKKRKIIDSDNPSETYILLQNEELSNQNKQLIQEKKQLETDKNEIEEWLDKSDKDKKYMRDFMKTIVQTNSLQKSIMDNQELINKSKILTINTIQFLIGFHFFLIYIEIPALVLNIYLFSYLCIIPALNGYQDKYIKNIDKYKKELETLKKNNDFLNDYVDNM